MPVNRFINDCLFARNSVASKDRHHLFLLVRTRIIGEAYDCLQDRDTSTLEELLKQLKSAFTEHRNLSQLNTVLATVAQREDESVLAYGGRVGKILTSLIELIEDQHPEEVARVMIKSARETARENFIIGLKRDLVMNVRIGRPHNLQKAINLARAAEWEVGHESTLDRKNIEGKVDESTSVRKSQENENTKYRFSPYTRTARARTFEVGRGRGSGGRGKYSGGRGAGNNGGLRNGDVTQTQNGCERCGEDGHMARGCLRVINDGSRTCFKCNKPGHFARECPNVKGTSLECFNCKKVGHMARNCPEKPNNGKGKEACKYCKKPGHHYDNCFARLAKIAESHQEKEAHLNE